MHCIVIVVVVRLSSKKDLSIDLFRVLGTEKPGGSITLCHIQVPWNRKLRSMTNTPMTVLVFSCSC